MLFKMEFHPNEPKIKQCVEGDFRVSSVVSGVREEEEKTPNPTEEHPLLDTAPVRNPPNAHREQTPSSALLLLSEQGDKVRRRG